jgi:hypothetical protein
VAAAGSSGWRVAALQSDPVLPVGGEQEPASMCLVLAPAVLLPGLACILSHICKQLCSALLQHHSICLLILCVHV